MCLAGRVPALLVGLAGAIVVAGSLAQSVAAASPRRSSPQAPAEPRTVPRGAPPANLPTGSLGGTVVSSVERAPLARARVVLTSAALAAPRVTLSGADGTYLFEYLPPGSYSLSAMRSGYAPQDYGPRRSAPAPVSLGGGQRLTGVDVVLAPAGVIAGRVFDEDDKPLAGARLDALVSRIEADQPTLVSVATAPSDDRGEFRLTGLPAGQYYVSVFDPAFAEVGDETGPLRYTPTYYPGVAVVEQASRVGVTPGTEPPRISFKLKIIRPSRIAGVIAAEGGRPLLSGAVMLAPIHGEWLNAVPTQDVVILPNGSFAFRNVPPGRYQIRARGEVESGGKSLFATYKVLIEGHDIANVDMALEPGASAAGELTFEAVGPAKPPAVSGLRVRAPFADGSSFGDTLTGEVLANGSFAIRGLMAGSHILTVEGLQYPWVLKSVTYRGQDITDSGLDVGGRLQRFENVRVVVTDVASDLSGVVRDRAGAPVPDATVLIVPLSDQFWTRTSRRLGVLRTDAGGRYRVRGLPPGEYRAVASIEMDESEAYRPSLLRAFRATGAALTLKNLEAVVLDFPLTSLTGTTTGVGKQEAASEGVRSKETTPASSFPPPVS